MGFFDDAVGAISGGGSGLGPGMASISTQDDEANRRAAQQKSNEESLRSKQYQLAEKFRTNAPQYTDQLKGQLGQQVSQDLRQGLSDVKQDASRRGLLYSGINLKNQAAQRALAARNYATGSSAIEGSVDKQISDFENQALKSSLDAQRTEQSMKDAAYQEAMNRMEQRTAGTRAVLGAAGAIGGAYAGRKA